MANTFKPLPYVSIGSYSEANFPTNGVVIGGGYYMYYTLNNASLPPRYAMQILYDSYIHATPCYMACYPISGQNNAYYFMALSKEAGRTHLVRNSSDDLTARSQSFINEDLQYSEEYDVYYKQVSFYTNINIADTDWYEGESLDGILQAFANFTPEPTDTDPYAGGGNSDVGGGTGNFDNSSDTIPVPNLPSISGLNIGFFTAFVATATHMQNVANYLWATLIPDIEQGGVISQVIDSLKKVVSNPYDAIMGCSMIPVTPSTGGSKELKMYGVIQTGITIPYASSRWVTVDCGTLNINEYWGAYLDYSPYTKTTSLYLPYIGTVSIDIDLIMGKALQVVYHVDILSGICIAYILVNGSVEFSYQGHCATTIPITTADFTSAIQSGLGLVGNIANIVSAGTGGAVGGIGGAVLGAVGSAVSQSPAIASNVMNMKPDIKSGGGIGGAGGILGVQKPYLIIERPRQSAPKAQNTYTGYPCNIALSIKDCTGYTEFETINLDGVLLTGEEKDELRQILQNGVYL